MVNDDDSTPMSPDFDPMACVPISGDFAGPHGPLPNTMSGVPTDTPREHDLRVALLSILDVVDHTDGSCHFNERVGEVLPVKLIENARKALAR